jgi:ElaB/YqjD/DUF883 family membrane-anchored ribosome-binding protein
MFYEVPIVGGTVEVQSNKGEVQAELAKLQEELKQLKEGGSKVPKNKQPVRAQAGRTYVLLNKSLANWGKVPQQQADIAALLAESMEVGKPWTEAEVFALVTEYAGEKPSIANSVQHPTHLFTYYRGLKNNGKHAGYIARNFLRMVG